MPTDKKATVKESLTVENKDKPPALGASPCYASSCGRITLYLGDCLDRLREVPNNSVDSVVTDPPYGLSFMGKKWDYDVPDANVWRECLRVLKPGGYLLAFAGTRTQHQMAVRIEDAGFEIRDMIAWVYGSGFPKSLDVSKAIDKAAGADQEVVEHHIQSKSNPEIKAGGKIGAGYNNTMVNSWDITAPATDAAKQWDGWGTALKPALEPITVARKPFPGTVAANVLEHGTGAINVDGCRVGIDPVADASQLRTMNRSQKDDANGWGMNQNGADSPQVVSPQGRWPANLIHDGSDEVVGLFPNAVGAIGMKRDKGQKSIFNLETQKEKQSFSGATRDSGSAARFFYCAKASKSDRDEGCEGLKERVNPKLCDTGYESQTRMDGKPCAKQRNHHPTVKPTDLMRYLCRLVTPPGGIVLDPFMGSGSTGKSAMLEGFDFIGFELEPEYFEIAKARITKEIVQGDLFFGHNV